MDVLRRPRFEVTLPASIGLLVRLTGLLPQSLRDRVRSAAQPSAMTATQAATLRPIPEFDGAHEVWPTDRGAGSVKASFYGQLQRCSRRLGPEAPFVDYYNDPDHVLPQLD